MEVRVGTIWLMLKVKLKLKKNNVYPCIHYWKISRKEPQPENIAYQCRHRVKLASCKSALNPPVVYSTDRSKAVVLVLVLLFGALWFILRDDLLYVLPCAILFLCFSVLFNIAITSLGEERANLSAFRMFDRFVLVWISRFPFSSWCPGRAAVCDCGTPWTFLLPFLVSIIQLCSWTDSKRLSFFFIFWFWFVLFFQSIPPS